MTEIGGGAGDIEMIAAEYALGTLTLEERRAVDIRTRRDARLKSAVAAWELRLAPLNEALPGIDAPDGLFDEIEVRIDELEASTSVSGDSYAPSNAELISLERSVSMWRRVAVASSALAAGLAILVGTQMYRQPEEATTLVAVLQKDAASPAFLVTVDLTSKMLTVKPVAAKAEAGKSYELWLVADKLGAPKSLGLIDAADRTVTPNLSGYDPAIVSAATLAVSLEPEGGSQTGAPTGPVVFAGKLIETSR